MTTWEPTTRTPGRALVSDLRRLLALGNPRRALYRDAHYFAATVEVDPERMRPWLPFGVRLAEPARADVFTAFFPDCAYGSVYHEAGVFVHIQAGRRTGIHCPWMILDDDVALILGRELLGYPKKLGEIDWHLDGDTIHAEAHRRDSTLITMGGTLGRRIDDPPPILGRPHRNAMGLLGAAMPRFVGFTPGEHPLDVREVTGFEITLGGSERDPLDQMGLGRALEARLHRVDLTAGSPPIPLRPLSPLFTASRLRPRVL
ncbi:acetoacetate decarboxylase family protein [Streptomyces sp. UNOC14_S4]|uniref:acetoacetate decarboxylase family protein n=1 Tax=Streptomyces sp. UNOC14_S4 TaxID=2872340 RepID=UPI001E65A892|nr:acetoacetate decarboxylase family protein [Streptomyces sp. UNOC14_S4]MCC3769770.1 acetoacetate decarboxylase family protein [Streptomyces sp. UNOC14_S4]